MRLESIRTRETSRGLRVPPEGCVAQPLVVPQLPIVVRIESRLLIHCERRLVPAEEVERASRLLEAGGVLRVEARDCLEARRRLVHLTMLPLDQRLHVEQVLGRARTLSEDFLDEFKALVILLSRVGSPQGRGVVTRRRAAAAAAAVAAAAAAVAAVAAEAAVAAAAVTVQ